MGGVIRLCRFDILDGLESFDLSKSTCETVAACEYQSVEIADSAEPSVRAERHWHNSCSAVVEANPLGASPNGPSFLGNFRTT